jgi:hypothetical protein
LDGFQHHLPSPLPIRAPTPNKKRKIGAKKPRTIIARFRMTKRHVEWCVGIVKQEGNLVYAMPVTQT